mgnify:CR=1 FL=1
MGCLVQSIVSRKWRYEARTARWCEGFCSDIFDCISSKNICELEHILTMFLSEGDDSLTVKSADRHLGESPWLE